MSTENIEKTYSDYNIMDLFDEMSFVEKWSKVLEGIKFPTDTGEYKWAKYQILRLWAPFSAVVVPILALLFMMLLSGGQEPIRAPIEITVMEPEKMKELEPIQEVIEEVIKPDKPEISDIVSEMPSEYSGPNATPGPPDNFSPMPSKIDSVAITKSPIIFKGIYGTRNPGMIGKLTGGGAGGGSGTEDAVLKALRWLKKYQETDGHWDTKSGGGPSDHYSASVAMTGLALLTYLAHGETPASEEFGGTVEMAIRWLVDQVQADGRFKDGRNGDGNSYGHPIASYALCEAYGMTQVPMIMDAAKKATDVIIKGQHGCGIWNYNCDAEDRNDISYSGWCLQALKAAKMAGIVSENEGDAYLKKAGAGFKAMYVNQMFKYVMKEGGGHSGLSSVGVLSLQLIGEGKCAEVKSAMDLLNQTATCDWQNKWGSNPIYYWYYLTQAKFHVGRDTWNQWNRQFSVQTVKNQIVMKGAGIDGKDIGYWEGMDSHCKAYVYNTTLCTLMLEVYYRYLPTFKPMDEEIKKEDVGGKSSVDVKINI